MIRPEEITVITPCSRPHLLPLVGASIHPAMRWVVVLDRPAVGVAADRFGRSELYAHHDPKSCFGNAQRNFALDRVDHGYVYFLDDDNVMHERFAEKALAFAGGRATVVNQCFRDGRPRLEAGPGNMLPDAVDTAQVLLPAGMIGDRRWQVDAYGADGRFIAAVHHAHKGRFDFVPLPLSYYNYLRS